MDVTGGVSKTPAKSGARKTTSCGECQRRKQKCDRQWPCNQCTARRRVHLCRFETKKRKDSSAATKDNSSVLYAAATQSTRISDEDNGSPKSVEDDEEEQEKPFNLASMGFGVGASIIADLKELDIIDPPKSSDTAASTALTLLCAIPPRPYANLLVRFFLEDYNNIFFCIIHRETFMERYAAMWNERRREKWDLNFAALLLQICAIAVQFLPEKDVPTIEELNPSRPTLSRTYVDASEKLLDLGVPGSCIERVLAHYLMSFWLKNEGRAPHGWHRLSRAVREAQELQLHIDPSEDKFTDFDAQVRRYVWMSIRTIDNHFARGLSRPRMITDSSCNVAMPLPSFEGADGLDPKGPPPSPTVQPWWEHKLSRLFTDEEYAMFAEGDDGDDIQVAEKFFSMAERVLNFFEKLPAFLKCKLEPGVDLHWDAQAPYLPIQRAHMLSQMNHVLSSIYRPYMRLSFLPRALADNSGHTRVKASVREHNALCMRLRQAGVANALALVNANRIYFEVLQPHHYASAPLSFHPFEPSAQLCMFLLTEPELDPPLYERVHKAVTAVIERYTVIRTRIACGCSSERNQLGWFAVNAQMVLKALMKKVEAMHESKTSVGGSSIVKQGVTKTSKPSSQTQAASQEHPSQEHPSQGSTVDAHESHIDDHHHLTEDSSYDYQGADIFGKELDFNPSFDYGAEAAAAAAAVSAAAHNNGHILGHGDPGMEWTFDMGSDMVRNMMSPAFTFNPEDYEISF